MQGSLTQLTPLFEKVRTLAIVVIMKISFLCVNRNNWSFLKKTDMLVETNSDDMDFVSGKGCPSIESTWPGGYMYTMYKTQRRSSKWQRHYLWNLLTSAAFQFKLTGWGEKKIEKAVAHLRMHTITLFIQEIRAAIAEKKYWCYHDLSLSWLCVHLVGKSL